LTNYELKVTLRFN